jgi:response regulator of citrate/malate metabolism
MADQSVMTIASDDRFIQLLRWQLRGHKDGATRIMVARSIREACSLLQEACPRLIVVDWRHGPRYDDLNQLLWKTTVLAHRVPVLIVADCYRVQQATRLYRMGVADYISRTHHEHRFGQILDAYVRRSLIPRPGLRPWVDSPGVRTKRTRHAGRSGADRAALIAGVH